MSCCDTLITSGNVCACVVWVFVDVGEDAVAVVCKCTRNVEAFFKKRTAIVYYLYQSKRVKCWWYAIAVVLENASALRVVYSTRSRRVQV